MNNRDLRDLFARVGCALLAFASLAAVTVGALVMARARP